MRILLTGAEGVLADTILSELILDNELFLTDKKILQRKNLIVGDLSDFNFARSLINETNPDVIIHLAANTDVDFCEENKLQALLDNFSPTKNLVDIISFEKRKTKLFFTSTASVFNSVTKNYFSENEEVNAPANFYAFTKRLSEEYIQTYFPNNFTIFRLGWLIGNLNFSKKFLGKIYKKLIKGEKIFYAVDDIWGSLTFANDVALLIKSILYNDVNERIIHCVSDGKANRFDILYEIISNLRYDIDEFKIMKVPNSFFNLPAPRPKFELLSNAKLKELGIIELHHWKYSLKKYLETYGKNFKKN